MPVPRPDQILRTITQTWHDLTEAIAVSLRRIIHRIKEIANKVFSEFGGVVKERDGFTATSAQLIRSGQFPRTFGVLFPQEKQKQEVQEEGGGKGGKALTPTHNADIDRFETFAAEAIEVVAPALGGLTDWVSESVAAATKVKAEEDAAQLVEDLLLSFPMTRGDSGQYRMELKEWFSFLFKYSPIPMFIQRIEYSHLNKDEKDLLKAFVSSFQTNEIDYDSFFDHRITLATRHLLNQWFIEELKERKPSLIPKEDSPAARAEIKRMYGFIRTLGSVEPLIKRIEDSRLTHDQKIHLSEFIRRVEVNEKPFFDRAIYYAEAPPENEYFHPSVTPEAQQIFHQLFLEEVQDALQTRAAKINTADTQTELRHVYGFLPLVGEIGKLVIRIDASDLQDHEKVLFKRFILSFSPLTEVNFGAYFDPSISLDARRRFHELYVDEVGEAMQKRPSVKAAADPLAKVLERDFLRRTKAAKIGPGLKRQAIDRTERLLYPLLDRLSASDEFQIEKRRFIDDLFRTWKPGEIVSPTVKYALIRSEGTDDHLLRFFLNHLEYRDFLLPVLRSLRTEAQIREQFPSLDDEALPLEEKEALYRRLIEALLPELFLSERHFSLVLGQIDKSPGLYPMLTALRGNVDFERAKTAYLGLFHARHAYYPKLRLSEFPELLVKENHANPLIDFFRAHYVDSVGPHLFPFLIPLINKKALEERFPDLKRKDLSPEQQIQLKRQVVEDLLPLLFPTVSSLFKKEELEARYPELARADLGPEESKALQGRVAQDLLPELLSSEKYFTHFLGLEERSPEYDEEELGIVEKIAHIFAPEIVRAVFDKVVEIDLPPEGGGRSGIQQALDEIIQVANDHVARMVAAENAHAEGLRSVFVNFKAGGGKGLHPSIRHRTSEGVDDQEFRKKLKAHLSTKVLIPLIDTLLDEPMRKVILKEIWRRKEEILPLFVGKNRNMYVAVLKLFKTEEAFVNAGERTIQLYRHRFRDKVTELLMDKILEISEPARMQSLILQKIAPPVTNLLRSFTLSNRFLAEAKKNPEYAARLREYMEGDQEARARVSPTIFEHLRVVAEKLETEGVHCSLTHIQDAQVTILNNLSSLPKTFSPDAFMALLKSPGTEKEMVEKLIINVANLPGPLQLFSSVPSSEGADRVTLKRAISGYLRQNLAREQFEIRAEVIENVEQELFERLERLPPQATPAQVKEVLNSFKTPEIVVPPGMEALGPLLGNLVAGLGVAGGKGWATWGVSFLNQRLSKLIYPLLQKLRDADSPLGKLLSLSQPALTDLLSSESMHEIMTGAPTHIEDNEERHQAMEESLDEVATMLKMLVDQEAMENLEKIPLLHRLGLDHQVARLPGLVSQNNYRTALVNALERLTDQSWKNENLILGWVDVLAKVLTAPHRG